MTEPMQDVRIRRVPVKLVRRLKVRLASTGSSLVEWFLMAAARDAEEYEKNAGRSR